MVDFGAVTGEAGPRTQQQAGRSRRERRIVVAVVMIAIVLHGSGRCIFTSAAFHK
jgi:hypothetical protein